MLRKTCLNLVKGCARVTENGKTKGMRRDAVDLIERSAMDQGMSQPSSPRSRIRLFGNPFLEALTVISAPAFIMLWAIALPAIFVCALVFAPSLWAPAFVIAGILGWTLTEYALHRFVFHFDARSALLKQAIFVIHGNHHADPNDPLRNLMPPVVSLPVCGLVWFLCVSTIGPAGTWCLLGFMLGYVAYDLVHYASHQWPMKGRLARALKVHHMRHHHVRPAGNYAITGMAWDRVLKTRIGSLRKRA